MWACRRPGQCAGSAGTRGWTRSSRFARFLMPVQNCEQADDPSTRDCTLPPSCRAIGPASQPVGRRRSARPASGCRADGAIARRARSEASEVICRFRSAGSGIMRIAWMASRTRTFSRLSSVSSLRRSASLDDSLIKMTVPAPGRIATAADTTPTGTFPARTKAAPTAASATVTMPAARSAV
jgi:hypothetical protein